MPSNRKSSTVSTMRSWGPLGAVGFAFVIAILIGAGIGVGLYRLTGRPILFILFFFLGVAAGIVNLVRAMADYSAQQKKERDGKTGGLKP